MQSSIETAANKNLRALFVDVPDVNPPDLAVADITLDSRTTTRGALFLAVAGARAHGLSFAAQAVAQGARAIAYEPVPGEQAPQFDDVCMLPVPELSRWVGVIADRFFDSPSAAMQIVGVTGTNGKTTSAYLIPSLFETLGARAGYAGTLGYGQVGALNDSAHTTADCVTVHRQLADMRAAGDRFVAMEVSSHALDQGRVDGVRFDTALFTNLTRDHLDYHGSLAKYGAAKERLFHRAGLKHCVVNVNDAFGREMLARIATHPDHAPTTAYALDASHRLLGDRQLYATDIVPQPSGMRIEFAGSWGDGAIDSPLIGAFNAENVLGVLAALVGLDVPLNDAVRALTKCNAPPGRMETMTAAGKPTAVIDYAHTPDALAKALQTVREHTRGRVICVFGCGGDRDAGKRPLMGAIAEQYADRVVVTDDNPRTEDADAIVADILHGFDRPNVVLVERDRAKAIARALALADVDDVVLIAGKGHEAYQIVGRVVRPFSDRQVAAAWLEGRS